MTVLAAYRKAFGYLFVERALAISLTLFGLLIAGLQVMSRSCSAGPSMR